LKFLTYEGERKWPVGTSPLWLASQNVRDVLLFSKWLHAIQATKGLRDGVLSFLRNPFEGKIGWENPPKKETHQGG